MPWSESDDIISANKPIEIASQAGVQIKAFQPYLRFQDTNAGGTESRIQGADGKLIFYVQSSLNSGLPSVILQSLVAPPGQPTPSAIEIHAQNGLDTVGAQPFLTLTDSASGFAKARIQSAEGKLIFNVQSALVSGPPTVIFNSLASLPGQPLPSAVEVHAQNGIETVGYQPFLTLTDSNAGYAQARVQSAGGDLCFYSQGGLGRSQPEMIVESGSGDVRITGALRVKRDIYLEGADCAERFDAAEYLAAGTVVILGEDGLLRASREAYDHRVAGVIAGAGDYKPAIVMDAASHENSGASVALIGKTFCRVDATERPISVGDLLTSSAIPGHAMKAYDSSRAFGTILGKALRPLAGGTGLIPILVTLQ